MCGVSTDPAVGVETVRVGVQIGPVMQEVGAADDGASGPDRVPIEVGVGGGDAGDRPGARTCSARCGTGHVKVKNFTSSSLTSAGRSR